MKSSFIIILFSAWGLFTFAMAQTPAPGSGSDAGSGSASLMGTKVEDSEDLSEAAVKELRGNNSNQSETTANQNQQIPPEPKADIVIIKPPTLQERARMEREEIELEKAKRMLEKSGRPAKRTEAGQVGQGTEADSIGGGGGDGGEDDAASLGKDKGKWSMTKPPCLEDRAKMEMEEVLMAKRKGKGPGEGGGEGGGTGQGSGTGIGDGSGTETAPETAYHRTVKKVCKSKNMYECLAQDAKEREQQEREGQVSATGSGGDGGGTDGSSGDAEVKFKRPPVRFKTQQELEAEAKQIMNEKDQPAIGENSSNTDSEQPASATSVKGPTLQEKAKEVKSELEALKHAREVGSGGETPLPPTKDLE